MSTKPAAPNELSPIQSSALTDSRLAALCAQTAQQAFLDYQTRFDAITRRARDRFLARDWTGSFDDATERLHLYSDVLARLTTRIEELMEARLKERSIWTAIKAVYSSLIARSAAWEVAETFFNSLTRQVFATDGVDQTIEFVDTDFDAPPTTTPIEVRRTYRDSNLSNLLFVALTCEPAGGFSENCWNDLRSSVQSAAARIEQVLSATDLNAEAKLEVVGSAFYRGREAYLVGRVTLGQAACPIALALRHDDERGITLDAVMHGDVDLAILFSFTRSYFLVEVECPYELVRYLRQLMPHKRLIDLYNAIGFHRHGKTEFYRDFIEHLHTSRDRFAIAAGTPGMVMTVFTLPSYDVVFKLIKDRFDFPKESTRADVMRRYRLVFEHDRAGRLVEAHEFEHLRIARDRFEPALLEELLRDAGSIVKMEGDHLLIAHAYVERRIRPLNIFFREIDSDAAAAAGRDYGQSIKDLAASNIFPGDLFTKNFGVTRHGRVVFYDYDELCFVTDCNFRDMPQPTTLEQEMAAEPWFSVRVNDIFPEEFLQFLSFPEAARIALLNHHGDIFRADFWREMQAKLRAGKRPDVYSYPLERRLIGRRVTDSKN